MNENKNEWRICSASGNGCGTVQTLLRQNRNGNVRMRVEIFDMAEKRWRVPCERFADIDHGSDSICIALVWAMAQDALPLEIAQRIALHYFEPCN